MLTTNVMWMDTDVAFSRTYLGQLDSQAAQDDTAQVTESKSSYIQSGLLQYSFEFSFCLPVTTHTEFVFSIKNDM